MGKVTNPQEQQHVRLASYPHTPPNLIAIKIDAGQHQGIRNSIARPFPHPPSTVITPFNKLPPEIIHEVFSLIDIQTLFRFRQLNRYARELVSAVHDHYEAIMTHALDVVCALLRSNLASWFTLRDLFDVLCTQECSVCGYFGGLLFLPSLTRTCSGCIMQHLPFDMLPATDVAEKFELSLEFLHQSVPVLSTIPGEYHKRLPPHIGKTLIVAREQVLKAAAASGHQIGNKPVELPDCWESMILRRMATISLPCLRRAGSNRGALCTLQCRGCLFAFDKAGGHDSSEYFMSQTIGLTAFLPRDRLYSHSDFLEHLKQCPLARIAADYSGLKSKGHNLNFKMLGKFQQRWGLSDHDLVILGGYSWWK